VLRKVSGTERNWRILHNGEFNDLYPSSNIVCVLEGECGM
jgi:hypothetical protein